MLTSENNSKTGIDQYILTLSNDTIDNENPCNKNKCKILTEENEYLKKEKDYTEKKLSDALFEIEILKNELENQARKKKTIFQRLNGDI